MKTVKLFFVAMALLVPLCVNAQQRCSICSGSGATCCPSCVGYGRVWVTIWNPYYYIYQQVSQLCGYCGGYGVVKCGGCNGSGHVKSATFKSQSGSSGLIKTSETVRIVCSTGADKGLYSVYIGALGAKYVYFAGDYRRINSNGNNSFSCSGNTYYARS